MPKIRVIGVVFLCLVLFAAVASGKTSIPDTQTLYEKAVTTARSEAWKAINSGKCASATAAIMVDGKVVYAEGFGMADREKSIPVNKTTIFNIGSISKMHVAAAIMLLVDDGKVSLDRPVTDYLPEFKMADNRYKAITVRMTLNHTSGLPGTEGANSFGSIYYDNVKQETIDTLTRSHLKHAPGAMAVYCNDGFTLAEMIVERVSGHRYMDFLNERMFKPLGLKNTGMGVGVIKGKPVAFYYDPKTGRIQHPEVLSILGAGGLSSTAEELCRFVDALLSENRFLKKASLAEMTKAQPPASAPKLRHPAMSFGLGWDITSAPAYDAAGVRIFGKSGGTGHYSSMVFAIPDKRISVAFIGAGPESGAMTIALNILNAVLVEKKLIPEKVEAPFVPPAAQKLPQDHASLSGYYANQSKLGQVVFDTDKDTATVYFFKGQEKTPALKLVYNNGYYHDTEGNRFYFTGTGGETYLVAYLSDFKADMIQLQKVKTLENTQNLRINMDGKLWLRRNVAPFESPMVTETHCVRSSLYKDLPGYVFFMGIKKIGSAEFAGMPLDAIRDQTELTFFDRGGATWARVSDLLYSPAEDAAILKMGENSVKIGSDGYNQWLMVREDVIVNFTKSEKGRVIIFPSDNNASYDSAFDRGDAYVAKNSYIQFTGYADNVFTVRAKPAREDEKE